MLRDYTRYVIEEAWPAQRRGIIPEGGTARTTAFQEKLLAFQPQTRSEAILHAETIEQFGVGAMLNAVLTWLFDVDRRIVHLTLAGILSLFVALVVYLVVAMDNQFRGELSVYPEAFEIVQKSLMEPDR
jgi:hypothetical protein